MAPRHISVIGGLGYDLTMVANRMPEGGESLQADQYVELLGGKGANAAIATFRTCHVQSKDAHIPATVAVPGAASVNSNGSFASRGFATPKDDLEINVRMVGAVGDDKYGKRFYSELTKTGVDCSGVVTVRDTPSSVTFVIVEKFTRENRCLVQPGATASWRKEHFLAVEQLGHGIRPDLCVAQMEIDKEVVMQMIETAGRAGIDFILNAAPANPITYRMYQWITHLLLNETEAAIMSGRELDEVHQGTWEAICDLFLRRGVKNVVITLGAKGAYYANAKQRGHVPAFKVVVADTTGAGDTFVGCYSSDYLRQRELSGGKHWDIRKAVIRACKAAALTITKFGAQGGVPWADEIESFDAPELEMVTLPEPESRENSLLSQGRKSSQPQL